MALEISGSKAMDRFQNHLDELTSVFGKSLEEVIALVGSTFAHSVHAMNSETKKYRSESEKAAAKVQKELVGRIKSFAGTMGTASQIAGAAANTWLKQQGDKCKYGRVRKEIGAGINTTGSYLQNMNEGAKSALGYKVHESQTASSSIENQLQQSGQREAEIEQGSKGVEEKKNNLISTILR